MIELDMFELFIFVELCCKIRHSFAAVVISIGNTAESSLISHGNSCKLS